MFYSGSMSHCSSDPVHSSERKADLTAERRMKRKVEKSSGVRRG
jgi:hypothetical protein